MNTILFCAIVDSIVLTGFISLLAVKKWWQEPYAKAFLSVSIIVTFMAWATYFYILNKHA